MGGGRDKNGVAIYRRRNGMYERVDGKPINHRNKTPENEDVIISAKEILDIMNENEYEFYGLRADFSGLKSGDELENSHQWFQDYLWGDEPDYEDEEHPYNSEIGAWDDGELNGTSSVGLQKGVTEAQISKLLSDMKKYYKTKGHTNIYLIGGDDAEGGNDVGELIIANARVISEIKQE